MSWPSLVGCSRAQSGFFKGLNITRKRAIVGGQLGSDMGPEYVCLGISAHDHIHEVHDT